jgi:hypothetical protein
MSLKLTELINDMNTENAAKMLIVGWVKNWSIRTVLNAIREKNSDKITDKLAQTVIDWRRNNPFQNPGALDAVPGFGGSLDIPANVIAVKGEYFSIQSVADLGGVKRVIAAVLNNKSGEIEYWKEY